MALAIFHKWFAQILPCGKKNKELQIVFELLHIVFELLLLAMAMET